MIKHIPKNKIYFFRRELLIWYDSNARKFPWRHAGKSCYEIIIAEILLQRTKAETVKKHYEAFIKKYANWDAINKASLSDIESILKPFGLWKQRSKRLKELARTMVTNNGKLPENPKDIEAFPLFGQYIVNAILTQCYQQKKPFLDASMARLLDRFFGERKLVDIRYDPYLQELAHRIVKKRKVQDALFLNWAILDFASLVCLKQSPKCDICPLKNRCLYKIEK